MSTPAAELLLESAIKDLERIKANADMIGGELALFAYLLDMALVEAREQLQPEPNGERL
jgi:hypothetical protein